MDQNKQESTDLRRGKSVKVYQKINEGKRERVIAYQGKILKSRGGEANQMITVRQFVDGVDVDRIIPISAPSVVKIENIVEKVKKTRKKATKKASKISKKTSSKGKGKKK